MGKKVEQKSFPLKTQLQTFHTEGELIEWFDNWHPTGGQETYFDFCVNANYFPFIFTEEVNEYLQRHYFLKNFNIYSYNQCFDDLPAIYIDAIQVIENAMNEAINYVRHKS